MADKNGSARLAACAVGKYGGNAVDACAVAAVDFLIEDGGNIACSGGTDKAGCEKKGGGELAEYGFCGVSNKFTAQNPRKPYATRL